MMPGIGERGELGMRVLIIPSEYFVPAESPLAGIFQYDQAIALLRAGMRADVLAPELRSLRGLANPKLWRRRGFENDTVDGLNVFRWHGWHWSVPGLGLGSAPVWLRAGRGLFRRYVATAGKPDVVHAHNARYAGMLASWIKGAFGIPYVLTEHSTVYMRGRVPAREVPLIREAYRDADVRFFVSDALGDSVEGAIGSAARPSEMLPNLLDRQFESVALNGRNDRAGRRFRFLNVAELIPHKRHLDLLRAFARVARDRDCELRIVGGGPLGEELSSARSELGLRERVTFVGRIDRAGVKDELLACDAFVFPSQVETFGVALAEAFACGRPAVATASGGPDSMITEANGFLVPPGDIDALASALTRMIDEHARFDPATIQRQCLAHYGSARIVSRLIDTYRRVAKTPRL